MGKSSLRQKIETLVVVTVITLLVWLYAEGRNVTTYTNEPITVRFVSGDGEGLTISPEGPQRVLVSFQGSSAMKQALETITAEGPITLPVVEKPNEPSTVQNIVMKDALNASVLRDLGIQVTATDPAVLPVTVRRLVSVEMTVKPIVSDGELASASSVEPARVRVNVPAPLASMAEELSLIARVTEQELAGLPANTPRAVNVRLELPQPLRDQPVELATRDAAVTVTVRKQTDTIALTSMPIHINAPPLLLRRYRIDLPEDQVVIRDVKLSGPSDAIASIRDKQFRVWAELRPTADELDAGMDQAPLYPHLPPGVRLDSPLPRVPVTVTRLE